MNKLFEITTTIGNKLLQSADWIVQQLESCLNKQLFIAASVILFIVYLINIKHFVAIVTVGFALVMICYLILESKTYLLHIKGFLGVGLIYWLLFTLIIHMILYNIFKDMRITFLLYLIPCITWFFYSLIANNKVANTSNQILSGIFGIIVLMKDTILSMFPDTVLGQQIEYGYTVGNLIEMIFNFSFSPILVINIIATLLCTLKGYWIEKYNDNEDVGSFEA